MAITFLLQGANPPAFNNRVGFTSNPTNSNGWYEDVDSGLIRLQYLFENINVNLLAVTNSFTTDLPFAVATLLGFRGESAVSSMTNGVLGAVPGNVTASRNSGTGIVTLSVGFPILSSLSGLASAKIGIDFSAMVTF